jgi:hypothetical protein
MGAVWLLTIMFAVATSASRAPASAATFCPTPSTTKVLTLSYAAPQPAVTVHPGDSFVVLVPSRNWGPIPRVTIARTDAVRRECTQLLSNGSRREVLFATGPGKALLYDSLPPRETFDPVWSGLVRIVMPPTVLSPLPRVISAQLTRQGSYANPAFSGSLLDHADVPTVTAADILGFDGYALATVDGFEYPVVTKDAGHHWRVAGLWFAGPWADAGSFTSHMVTFSSNVAVSYDQSGDLYATSNGGAQWFAAHFPSMIMTVPSTAVTSNIPPTSLVVEIVRMGPHGPVVSLYRSVNGGRSWSLR